MRKKFLKWVGISLGVVLLVVAALGIWQRKLIIAIAENWDELSNGSEIAAKLKTADDVLEYIAAHRDSVSMAAWSVGDEANGIYLNADVPRPLASTVKVMVLAAYAAGVDAGELDPKEPVSLSSWERYWLPGTDGGAHPAAVKELRAKGAVTDDQASLRDVVWAMIRYSDNAATDLVMERIGRGTLEALPARLALPGEDAPMPLAGSLLTWRNTREEAPAAQLLARYRTAERADYADQAWELAQSLRDDDGLRNAEVRRLEKDGIGLTIREQAEFTKALNNRGTARGYASIMARVAADTLEGSGFMREQLEWPMRRENIQSSFETLGTKGGSLPGVLTSTFYAKPKGDGPNRVLALFFQDVPTAAWFAMMESAVHQQFELKVLEDDEYFQKVKARLAEGSPTTAPIQPFGGD